jgi:pimeloyl-ACP methyl ester carboxylesterase
MSGLHIREHWIDTASGQAVRPAVVPLQGTGGAYRPVARFAGLRGLVARLPAQLAQATGHQVIAYDRLGFGRSDAPRQVAPGLCRERGAAGSALREYFGIDFIVFGHSVGGGMAVAALRHSPASAWG